MATMPHVSFSVYNQVIYTLLSFNQSNSEALLDDLKQYIGVGVEGDILVLQSCLHYLDVFPKDLKTMPVDVVLEKIFRDLLQKPNFSTIFSTAFEVTTICGDFLVQMCNRLHLKTAERIQIGFALSASEDQKLRMCGKTFCTSQIGMLRASQPYGDSAEQIQNIVFLLLQSDSLSEHVSYFIRMLVRAQSEVEKDHIIQPFLSSELPQRISARNVDLVSGRSGYDFDALHDEMQKETDASEVMREMDYGCTNDVSQCKSMLSLFSPLTESTVAVLLGEILRTHADLDENQISFDLPAMKTWNIDVLVDSIQQLAPGINWVNVIEHLDHEGFYITDRATFSLLISLFRASYKSRQAYTGSISPGHLTKELDKFFQMFMDALVSTELSIEEEANSYFRRLFSGQLSVEKMMHILAQFKGSSDKRKHELLECVISYLFQEYKSFPKYPDKQLYIAAVFFGSLIKYRVVTDASLSTTLRAVLDALCKPADSKMLLFGVKALEQCLNRMVELPNFCNKILQISHLHSMHPEIVSSVRQSLSRYSSSYSEPDLGLTHMAGWFPDSAKIQVFPSLWAPPPGSMSESIQQQQSSLEDKQKESKNLPLLTQNAPSSVISSSAASSLKDVKVRIGTVTIAIRRGDVILVGTDSRSSTYCRVRKSKNKSLCKIICEADKKKFLVGKCMVTLAGDACKGIEMIEYMQSLYHNNKIRRYQTIVEMTKSRYVDGWSDTNKDKFPCTLGVYGFDSEKNCVMLRFGDTDDGAEARYNPDNGEMHHVIVSGSGAVWAMHMIQHLIQSGTTFSLDKLCEFSISLACLKDPFCGGFVQKARVVKAPRRKPQHQQVPWIQFSRNWTHFFYHVSGCRWPIFQTFMPPSVLIKISGIGTHILNEAKLIAWISKNKYNVLSAKVLLRSIIKKLVVIIVYCRTEDRLARFLTSLGGSARKLLENGNYVISENEAFEDKVTITHPSAEVFEDLFRSLQRRRTDRVKHPGIRAIKRKRGHRDFSLPSSPD